MALFWVTFFRSPWGVEGSGDMRLNPDSGPGRGRMGSGKREDAGREGAGALGARRARTPAHGQGLGVAALVHQLVAVLDQRLQLRLVAGHPQEPGQLLHHGHQVLEDKGGDAGARQRRRLCRTPLGTFYARPDSTPRDKPDTIIFRK